MSALGVIDWVGLTLWAALWLGYVYWAGHDGRGRPSIMSLLAKYRRIWMREAYNRDNRITDVALIGSLAQSATFFSSTTLLILGGLFALLGTIDKSAEVVRGLPFAARTSQDLLEMKALLLWLINPWLLIGGSLAITAANWYMEFRSATVRALAHEHGEDSSRAGGP